MLITLDEIVGEQRWWPAYCPNISNHQMKVAEPAEAVVPEGIPEYPNLPSETTSWSVQENLADKDEGPIVVTLTDQIDGKVDSGNKEHHNEIAGSEVSISTEKNLETTISAAPEVDDSPNRLLNQFGTTTALAQMSDNSPAFSTETEEAILVTESLTSCDELVQNLEATCATTDQSSIPVTPNSTVPPSAILKALPSVEVKERRKEIQAKVKELKKFVRFMRKFAKFQKKTRKRTNRKRKADKTGGQSKPEADAGPSAPKQRKLSTRNRTPTVRKTNNNTAAARVSSVRKFQKHRHGKNLAPVQKCRPPTRSVAQFFGQSTSGRSSNARSIPGSATIAKIASPNSTTTADGSEITGPSRRPGTPDCPDSDLENLDFDCFGNTMEGGKDFFDDLLGNLPELGIDEAELLDLSGIIDLALIDDYIGAQNTGVSCGTGRAE